MSWLRLAKAAKIVLPVLFLALAGCDATSDGSDESAGSEIAKSTEVAPRKAALPKTFFDTLSVTSVVVRVDGEEITKADIPFETWLIQYRMKLLTQLLEEE